MRIAVSTGVLLSSVILLLAPTIASAQDDETLIRLGLRTRAFLEQLAEREVDDALDNLLTNSPLAHDEQQVAQLKSRVQRGLEQNGQFLRVEPVRVERIGTSMVRCIYLYHCRDFPIVWRLIYYRPTEELTWNVISLHFGLDYDSLPANGSASE